MWFLRGTLTMPAANGRVMLMPGPGAKAAGKGGTKGGGPDRGYKRSRRRGSPELEFLGPQGKVLATGLRDALARLANVYHEDEKQVFEEVKEVWEQLADFVVEEAIKSNPEKFAGPVYSKKGPLRYKYCWPGMIFFLSLLSSNDEEFLAGFLNTNFEKFKDVIFEYAQRTTFEKTENLQVHWRILQVIEKPQDAKHLAKTILIAAGQVLQKAKKARSDRGLKQLPPYYRMVVELDEGHRGLSLAEYTLKHKVEEQGKMIRQHDEHIKQHDRQIVWMLGVELEALGELSRSGDYRDYINKKRKLLKLEAGARGEPDAEP